MNPHSDRRQRLRSIMIRHAYVHMYSNDRNFDAFARVFDGAD